MTKAEIVKPNLIDTIKKKQILEEITQANPTIPYALLELIWDSVKIMDDRKLKQLRKGNVKIKNPIKRPVFEDGQILTGCCEIKENDFPVVKEIVIKEEPEERLTMITEDELENERDNKIETITYKYDGEGENASSGDASTAT